MVWKLTPELLAYGRQHIKILTSNANCPNGLALSKIPVSGSSNPTPYGIKYARNGTGDFGTYSNSLYGVYKRVTTRNIQEYEFRIFKHFIPTQVKWRWAQADKGWTVHTDYVQIYNAGVQIVNNTRNAVTGTKQYDITDATLLSLDLSHNDTYLRLYLDGQTTGWVDFNLQISGFQLPYPNLAAIKNHEGEIIWPLQLAAMKINNTIQTAGQLV